jgi:hypothetical protein
MQDDKKKITVLAVLVILIIGVGVFQITRGSSPAPEAAAGDTAETSEAASDGAALTASEGGAPAGPRFALASLPQRNPFKPGRLAPAPTPTPTPQPQPQPLPPAQPERQPRPPRVNGNLPQQSLPPFQVEGLPALPGDSGTVLVPTAPPEPVFAFTLNGVIVGERSAAVFRDSEGNQRLVSVGGSIDGDSQLIAVQKGSATVRFRGKTLRLTMGGNPSEN